MLRISDENRLTTFYESAFRAFQQINCCQIAKAWIKTVEPRKQVKHPYCGDRKTKDPEKTKPAWWPAAVTHRKPDHLKKCERVQLLVHILRELHKSHGITAEKLNDVGNDVRRQIKPPGRWDILEEIYMVRRLEESYERGDIDANTEFSVTNLEVACKIEQDAKSISDNRLPETKIINMPLEYTQKSKQEIFLPGNTNNTSNTCSKSPTNEAVLSLSPSDFTYRSPATTSFTATLNDSWIVQCPMQYEDQHPCSFPQASGEAQQPQSLSHSRIKSEPSPFERFNGLFQLSADEGCAASCFTEKSW